MDKIVEHETDVCMVVVSNVFTVFNVIFLALIMNNSKLNFLDQ